MPATRTDPTPAQATPASPPVGRSPRDRGEPTTVADPAAAAGCCPPAVQVSCCAPEQKAGCCGATPEADGTCGCQD